MGDLTPIAFDIETSRLEPGAAITVAGLAFELGEVILLNTANRSADVAELETRLSRHSAGRLDLKVCEDEHGLLTTLTEVSTEQINTDAHYLTAYHGETWNGGFDLPFLRTSRVTRGVPWPFPSMAYADMLDVVDRFETDETHDLVGVYDYLIGEETCDPFTDSEEAVAAYENAEWEELLFHNLADIQRTRELAVLACEYVSKSDFRMKNLNPPGR